VVVRCDKGGRPARTWSDDFVLLLDFQQLESGSRHIALFLRCSALWQKSVRAGATFSAARRGKLPRWLITEERECALDANVNTRSSKTHTFASLKKWSWSVCFVQAATTGRYMVCCCCLFGEVLLLLCLQSLKSSSWWQGAAIQEASVLLNVPRLSANEHVKRAQAAKQRCVGRAAQWRL